MTTGWTVRDRILAKIQRSTTNNYQHCGRVDTLIHRLTECSEGADIWRWTRSGIASILRMDPKYILPEWTVRPSFHFWPPQRDRAILWILAHMVYYRTHHWHRVSTIDYADCLRRARWKAYQTALRREKVGNYLEILQSPTHNNWRNCVPSSCRLTESQYHICKDSDG
jgi:hypothetical protein